MLFQQYPYCCLRSVYKVSHPHTPWITWNVIKLELNQTTCSTFYPCWWKNLCEPIFSLRKGIRALDVAFSHIYSRCGWGPNPTYHIAHTDGTTRPIVPWFRVFLLMAGTIPTTTMKGAHSSERSSKHHEDLRRSGRSWGCPGCHQGSEYGMGK